MNGRRDQPSGHTTYKRKHYNWNSSKNCSKASFKALKLLSSKNQCILYFKILPESSHFWPIYPSLQEQSPLSLHSNVVEPSGLH